MKLTFRLRFHTKVGQSLFITGSHESLGGGRSERAVPLQYFNLEFWQVTLPLSGGAFSYNYILRNADGSTIQDWGDDRVINPADFKCAEILIVDSWNHPGSVENTFYTEPFQDVLLLSN